ncbi:hypothetical protein RND71_035018 [Anisodus tanguticus]|uniref:Uncharacterized protein n=1 Tax=Anisodus tanguticus TaxID=243964 RepID=A0AAE1UVG5_9SOLA|nr:hypothetical protein RND71_035018 [Anisodus tanguticus]
MNEREGDLRVPLISFLLCLCVLIGGIFLFLYLFVPNLSKPWFPPIALILIGFPWLLWLLTYIYTCIKRCFGINSIENRQISRRTSRAPTMANSGMARNASMANNNNDGKQAQFGAASLNSSHGSKSADASSINSSQEIEMPLTTSAPS